MWLFKNTEACILIRRPRLDLFSPPLRRLLFREVFRGRITSRGSDRVRANRFDPLCLETSRPDPTRSDPTRPAKNPDFSSPCLTSFSLYSSVSSSCAISGSMRVRARYCVAKSKHVFAPRSRRCFFASPHVTSSLLPSHLTSSSLPVCPGVCSRAVFSAGICVGA